MKIGLEHVSLVSLIGKLTHFWLKQVEQKTNVTPKKRAITIPSMESIEEMRTPVRDVDMKSRLKGDNTDNKILQDQHRIPFQDVNGLQPWSWAWAQEAGVWNSFF